MCNHTKRKKGGQVAYTHLNLDIRPFYPTLMPKHVFLESNLIEDFYICDTLATPQPQPLPSDDHESMTPKYNINRCVTSL